MPILRIKDLSKANSIEDTDLVLVETKTGTMSATVGKVKEALGETNKSQSDWDQSDESAPDYIKGKTHYRTKIENPVVFEGDYEFIDGYASLTEDASSIFAALNSTLFYRLSINEMSLGDNYLEVLSGVRRFQAPTKLDVDGNGDRAFSIIWNSVEQTFRLSAQIVNSVNLNGVFKIKFEIADAYEYSFIEKGYLHPSLGEESGISGWAFHRFYGNTATGMGALSGGSGSNASGEYSVALGAENTASGSHSVALGGGANTAHDMYSLATGLNSEARGMYAIAMGYKAITNGRGATAIGYDVEASGKNQMVRGTYNIKDTTSTSAFSNGKYLEIVGNGTSGTKRSNAYTLDWNGLGWFKGGLKIGGTSQDDTSAKEVALKEDIPTDDHINNLINTALGVIENGTY